MKIIKSLLHKYIRTDWLKVFSRMEVRLYTDASTPLYVHEQRQSGPFHWRALCRHGDPHHDPTGGLSETTLPVLTLHGRGFYDRCAVKVQWFEVVQ